MDELRSLPKVDALSRAPGLSSYPERVRVESARQVIEEMRQEILNGRNGRRESAEERAAARAAQIASPSLGPAINLSGVILHTGLGRARLAKAAVDQIGEVAANHAMVELDEDTGKRGDRQEHVRELLTGLTGAEDAFVVNNAAAALFLTLTTLSKGRDVILSRGQMVEIGGSFRIPEIVAQSGCNLVEVGCTNKTRISDYEGAIHHETGAILRCHTSNYKIIGFAEQPPLEELVRLAHAFGVPCVDDMGTGCLVDTTRFGLERVPTLVDSVRAGADIVTASGDKLLGGPQAGIIVGRSEAMAKIRRHPLARAVRVDKLTLAGLEATLRLYRDGREMEVPTIAYMARGVDEVESLAKRLGDEFAGARVEKAVTEIGGGSAPGMALPTWRVGLTGRNPEDVLATLRHAGRPIIGRIEDGMAWLDPRTLDEDEVDYVVEVLKSL